MTTTPENPQVQTHDCSQLQQLVQRCRVERMAIVDYGQAHQGVGNPPPEQHVRLLQQGGILEHYERDFTVRAAAGVTMGQLQAQLRQAGQFCPIDADDDMTLGEVIAHHVWGPLRVGFGSIRDHLLGLRFVDGQGRDIQVGGRTVKNVAGYDVSRLMVGSLGELGLIYEATLRTWAVPEGAIITDVSVQDPAALDRQMTDWLVTDARPSWLSLHLQQDHNWVVRVAYLGKLTGCAVQRRALETFLDKVPGTRILSSDSYSLEQDALQRTGHRTWRRHSPAVVKLIVPPDATGSTCQALLAWAQDSRLPLLLDALPVHGCIFAGGGFTADQAADLETQAAALLRGVNGFQVWYARPAGSAIASFDPLPSDFPILCRIKRLLDPLGLFNPGRLLDLTQEPSPR